MNPSRTTTTPTYDRRTPKVGATTGHTDWTDGIPRPTAEEEAAFRSGPHAVVPGSLRITNVRSADRRDVLYFTAELVDGRIASGWIGLRIVVGDMRIRTECEALITDVGIGPE